jgi:hypothetical protein
MHTFARARSPPHEAPQRTVPLPDEFLLVFVGTRNVLLVVHAVLLAQSTRRDDHTEQPPHAQLFSCTCTPTRPTEPVCGRAPLLLTELTQVPPRLHAEPNSSEHALLFASKRLAILHCTHITSPVVMRTEHAQNGVSTLRHYASLGSTHCWSWTSGSGLFGGAGRCCRLDLRRWCRVSQRSERTRLEREGERSPLSVE